MKIFDITSKQRITNVPRDDISLRPDMYPCSLCWKDNVTLIIGWGTSVKVGLLVFLLSSCCYRATDRWSRGILCVLCVCVCVWTVSEVLIKSVMALPVSCVLVPWPRGMWDLSSLARDQTHTPCIGRPSPNHWTPRKVQEYEFLNGFSEPKYFHLHIMVMG